MTYSDTLVITLGLNDDIEVEGGGTVKVRSKPGNNGCKKGDENQVCPPGAPPGQQNKDQGKPEHPPHPNGKQKKNKGGT